MSLIQISKLQQRSGNLVDLPQLSEAEFGWATDQKRLFIGKDSPAENIEVLTSYSEIDFSQLNGSVGNLNISANVANGEVLTFNGSDWVNRGGNSGGYINLGNASNVSITGGGINYVLTTDGIGNLSWTPKGGLYTKIVDLTPDTGNTFGYGANVIIMEVDPNVPYVNGTRVTLTGIEGASNANLNSQNFFIKLANDYPSSGNTILFTSDDLANANAFINGTVTYTNSPNGIATSTIGGGTGSGVAAGTTYTIQYNNGTGFGADANLTWDFNTRVLNVNGNVNTGPILSNSTVSGTRFISNVATGTAPLAVSSTTLVANLNAALLNGFNTSNTTVANTVVVRTSTGSLEANVVTANTGSFTTVSGNGIGLSSLTGANVTGFVPNAVHANTAATITTNAQPNITSVGTLTNLSVTGNTISGNVLTDNYQWANGAPVSFDGTYSNSNVASYLPTYSGTVGAGGTTFRGNVITTGANVTAGTITGTWTLTAGSTLQATYADLAEKYESDKDYPPGTVVEFGGEKEITIAEKMSTRIAGVISSNPAYVMNAESTGLPVALQGRVPCKVVGKVRKGDMMVSAGHGTGYAMACENPKIGSVIGKALENYDAPIPGMIEVVVGRI